MKLNAEQYGRISRFHSALSEQRGCPFAAVCLPGRACKRSEGAVNFVCDVVGFGMELPVSARLEEKGADEGKGEEQGIRGAAINVS